MRRLTFILCCIWALPALAHKPSDSYLTLTSNGSAVEGRWDIALRDLDYAVGLDGNGDGAITWGELRSRHAAISAYALARLTLHADGQACPTEPLAQQVTTHSDGSYTVLSFRAQCPEGASQLTVRYALFFDLDPSHQGLLRLTAQHSDQSTGNRSSNNQEWSAVLTPATPTFSTGSGRLPAWRGFLSYLQQGIVHIWTGYDHLAFLLLLLLPAAARRSHDNARAIADLRAVAWRVVQIVTAFSIAHSLTLGAAALGLITLPARPVEIAIAASVAAAGIYNLLPSRAGDGLGWKLAFGFGLLHGFGFANVLDELGVAGTTLAAALAGFNIGVELGQLAIVAAALPLLVALGRTALYARAVVPLVSLALTLAAGVWTVERTLA